MFLRKIIDISLVLQCQRSNSTIPPICLSLHASLSRPSILRTQKMSVIYIYILNIKYGTLDYLLGGMGNCHSGYI